MDPTILITLISQAVQTAMSLKDKFSKKDDAHDPTRELSERLQKLSGQVQVAETMIKSQNEVLVKLGESCRELALLVRENQKRSQLSLAIAIGAAAAALIVLALSIAWHG